MAEESNAKRSSRRDGTGLHPSVEAPSDIDLLEQWRAGNQAGGRDLFARYFEPLRRFFANKCNDPDEMVQATFMAMLKAGRSQFAGRSSFRTYLYTIARNELYRAAKKQARTTLFDPEVSSIEQVATTIGSRLARNQEHRRLCAALRKLPLEQQTLLELHYWNELDIPQLAEIFDCEAGAMRMRLHRARTALRDFMVANNDIPLDALETNENFDTWARSAA